MHRLCWILVLICTCTGCTALEVAVNDGLQFYTAFTSTNVTRILLTQDVALNPSDWEDYGSGSPFHMERNLTILGNHSDSKLQDVRPVLNFNFLTQKVFMAPGVTLTIQHCIIFNVRLKAGTAIDIFVNSPGASFYTVDTAKLSAVCVLPNVTSTANEARSLGYPGAQRVELDSQFCNGDTCWHPTVHFLDYAVDAPGGKTDLGDNSGGCHCCGQPAAMHTRPTTWQQQAWHANQLPMHVIRQQPATPPPASHPPPLPPQVAMC